VRKTLTISDGNEGVAYLTLPEHPGKGTPGAVAKQTRFLDLMTYVGPDIYFDLDKDGTLIGVEILT
jgi:hypothetical protein